MMGTVASQVTATATIINMLGGEIGISYERGALIACAVFIVYTATSGLFGVIYTDVFQFIMLILFVYMPRSLLAAALGAISSYSAARNVHAVRLVFCDAAAYDQGVVRPDSLAGAVHVQGRRGTQLQPGIDLLERAEDFPKDAPILLITDGQCEHLHLHGRTHAYLLPKGRSLPFAAKGEVFWLDESSLTRMIYVPNKSAIS